MIVITIDEAEAASEVCRLITPDLPPGSVQLSSGSRGFDGTIGNDIVILAAMVSPVAIKRIADVLISLIGSKSNREVSVNGINLKGYSADDAARLLLASASPGETPRPPAS